MELALNYNCFDEMNEYDLLSIEGGVTLLQIAAAAAGGLMVAFSPVIGAMTAIATIPTGPISLGIGVGTTLTVAGTGLGLIDYALSK